MKLELETDHLIIKALTPDWAGDVLTFYKKNIEVFEMYEPIIDENFLSIEHQEHMLTYEQKAMMKLAMVRYYFFEKGNHNQIIGTVSFRNIIKPIYASCTVGYKMDQDYMRKGYCYEALSYLIPYLGKELELHRFEALVMPDNYPSINLLEKLGFEKEGLLREKIRIKGKFEDHYIYSYLVK